MDTVDQFSDTSLHMKKASKSLAAPAGLKYAHPKVMLIDCSAEMARYLTNLGYNVTVGSFGKQYKVPKDGGWRPALSIGVSLQGLTEQEIVIIDLRTTPIGTAPPIESVGVRENELWIQCTSGTIDPRPRIMSAYHEYFDRILDHGGQFIIFASSRSSEEFAPGRIRYPGDLEFSGEAFRIDNWAFLSTLDAERFTIQFDHGTEMRAADENLLTLLLSRSIAGASFNCKFSPRYTTQDQAWLPLLRSKFHETVAGLLLFEKSRGGVLLLPDLSDEPTIVAALLKNILPNINASLFPGIEGASWVHRARYELPSVLSLTSEIAEVKQSAAKKVKELTAKIAAEREQYRDSYTLLRGTGRELVEAVIRTLRQLGFEQVVDVDFSESDTPGGKREDIQIADRSPVLIVDVKGVHGHPEDAESTQSEKHATMRMREWQRTDVQPLTIINHQRHLPPGDRDQQAYRTEIVGNALHTQLGLMTTWDLWKIARNAERLAWPKLATMDIFYQTGRIDVVPSHYKVIGCIVEVWKIAFGVVSDRDVAIGMTLSVEVGDSFEEFEVVSLRVENKEVVVAPAGSNCGVGFAEATTKLRGGERVFVVQSVAKALSS